MPRLQRHVIRILFMVPIYAVDCWLALRFKDATIYFDTVRECYEAYVIYNFYTYCTVYLEAFCNPGLEQIVARKPQRSHVWPISAFLDMPKMGEPFLRICVATASPRGVDRLRRRSPRCARSPRGQRACTATGKSPTFGRLPVPRPRQQRLASVGDVLPDFVLPRDVRGARAHPPVLQVSHRQSRRVRLLLATKLDMIDSLRGRVKYKIIVVKETWTDYDAADVATGLQEFAICVEMFFAAIAHAYAFPPSEYAVGALGSAPTRRARR